MSSAYSIAGVEISRPEKVFFPADESSGGEVTKSDLAQYYADVADVMLPHLHNRPISMHRFPDGIEGGSFFEKKIPDYFPSFVNHVTVETSDGTQQQVAINNLKTLVYLADQACITPHTWLATQSHLRKPDQLIFDLDPSVPGVAAVRKATKMVGELLDQLGLKTYLKTTGSRGYHVVVPIQPREDIDKVREFARGCAELLTQRDPDLLTVEARKDQRGERVLVDIARNAYAQTAVAPYAVRARPGAPVATPITWDELSSTDPQHYTIASVRHRLAQRCDPWTEFNKSRQGLSRASEELARLSR